MTPREQRIYNKAYYDFSYWGVFEEDRLSEEECFIEGAKWADNNQPNPWKSIETELPEEGDNIIIYTKLGSYSIELYDRSKESYYKSHVDYWMLIPKIPKSEFVRKEDHDPYPEE